MSKQLQIEQMRDRLEKYMEMPVSDSMVERVALYHTAMCAMCGDAQPDPDPAQAVQVASVQEALEPVTEGTGAFHDAVRGKQPADVYDVLERHFEVLAAIAPKQYAAVMSALDRI